MPDDPTQQPDQSQLPSWISRAGSAIGSGLTQALPYAVPAVLGAAMGRGVGGGAVAGALAGAGMAGGDIQEQQNVQQELAARRQQLTLEGQRDQLLAASIAQKGSLGEQGLQIKQQQANTQAEKAGAYADSLKMRNEQLQKLDALRAQQIAINKANLGLRGDALKQGQEKLDDVTKQQEATIEKLAETHAKLITSDHYWMSGDDEEKAQKAAADDLINHFHSIGIGVAAKPDAKPKVNPNAQLKGSNVPPPPAGFKVVE